MKGLFELFRVHRWALPALVLLGLLRSLTEGIGIGLFVPLLGGLVGGDPSGTAEPRFVEWMTGFFGDVPPEQRTRAIALVVFAAIVASALLSYLHGALSGWVDGSIGHHLRQKVFGRLLRASFGFIERDRSGHLLNVLTSDTWRTSDALKILIQMIVTTGTVLVYVALLLLLSWQLTVLVGLAVLLVSLLIRAVTTRVRELGKTVIQCNTELADRMVEGIDGMSVIRSCVRESYEQRRFDRASDRLRAALFRLTLAEGAVHPIYEVMAAAMLLATLFLTAWFIGDISILLVFMFVLYRLQPRVKELESSRVSLMALLPSVDEVRVLISSTDDDMPSGTIVQRGLDRGIAFEDVTFRYHPSDEPALAGVSFEIPARQTTALVGPSGSGKSTITKLLLRFYDPTAGRVLVDGRDLSQLALDAWRNQIALVSQDVYLFNATVEQNIAYGRLDATRDEIMEAARKANAHDFIEQLPQKYETALGHHGVRLSGGQRQRISLARAIIRDPRILILDEATNALDSLSEDLIQETLETFRDERTVIVVAHRLSTIEQANQIVVLDGGRVLERGTFQELAGAAGLFAELHRRQRLPSAVYP